MPSPTHVLLLFPLAQVAVPYEDAQLSTETRAAVEAEVRKLVTAAHERARSVLRAHERELHALAGELLDKETLTGGRVG